MATAQRRYANVVKVIGPGRFIMPPKGESPSTEELAQPMLNNKFGWLTHLIGAIRQGVAQCGARV